MFINILTSFVSSAQNLRDRGAVAGEYAVLLALVALALVAGIQAFSGAITAALNNAAGIIN